VQVQCYFAWKRDLPRRNFTAGHGEISAVDEILLIAAIREDFLSPLTNLAVARNFLSRRRAFFEKVARAVLYIGLLH